MHIIYALKIPIYAHSYISYVCTKFECDLTIYLNPTKLLFKVNAVENKLAFFSNKNIFDGRKKKL